jgi:hypothetical protein
MSHCEWAVCGYEGFFGVGFIVVCRYSSVCNQIKVHNPWLQGGCQVRLAGSASMDGFVSQLTLLARGWGGRVDRSKRGFGLPGDCSEMSLPFFMKGMYVELFV